MCHAQLEQSFQMVLGLGGFCWVDRAQYCCMCDMSVAVLGARSVDVPRQGLDVLMCMSSPIWTGWLLGTMSYHVYKVSTQDKCTRKSMSTDQIVPNTGSPLTAYSACCNGYDVT